MLSPRGSAWQRVVGNGQRRSAKKLCCNARSNSRSCGSRLVNRTSRPLPSTSRTSRMLGGDKGYHVENASTRDCDVDHELMYLILIEHSHNRRKYAYLVLRALFSARSCHRVDIKNHSSTKHAATSLYASGILRVYRTVPYHHNTVRNQEVPRPNRPDTCTRSRCCTLAC